MSYRSDFNYNSSQNSADFDRLNVGKFTLTAKGLFLGTNLLIDANGNLTGKVVSGFANALPNQLPNVSQNGLFTGVRQTNPQATLDVSGTANILGSITCASTISAIGGSITTLRCSTLTANNVNAGTYNQSLSIQSSGVVTIGSISTAFVPSLQLQSSAGGRSGIGFGTYSTNPGWVLNTNRGGSNPGTNLTDFYLYNYATGQTPLQISADTNNVTINSSTLTCNTISAGSYLGLNPTFVGSGSSLLLQNASGTHLTLINPTGGGTVSFADIDFAGYSSPAFTNGAPMSIRFWDDYAYSGIMSLRAKAAGSPSNAQSEILRVTQNGISSVGTQTNAFTLINSPGGGGGAIYADSNNVLNICQYGTQVVTNPQTPTSNTAYNNYGTWTALSSSTGGTIAQAYQAVNGSVSTTAWSCAANYSSSTGAYQGTVSTVVSGSNVTGEWWGLNTTTPFYPRSVYTDFFSSNYTPKSIVWAGSNDGVNFTNLATATLPGSLTYSDWTPTSTSTATTAYSNYRIICTSTAMAGLAAPAYCRNFGMWSVILSGLPVSLVNPPLNSVIAVTNNSVGINTKTPQYSLDVAGTSRVVNQSAGVGGTFLALASTAANRILFVDETSNGGTVGASMRLYSGYTSQISSQGNLALMPGYGNLGISNTSPAYPLDVAGQGRFVSNGANQVIVLNTSTSNSTDACEVKFDRTAGLSTAVSAVGVGASTRGAYWWVNGNDRININASGQVGVNTSSPGYTLDVNGNFHCNYAYIGGGSLSSLFNFSQSGQNGLTWGPNTNSKIVDDGDLRIATDDNMHFYTGCNNSTYGTERMTIANGNVGINNTNPSYTLDVSGGIRGSTSGGFFNWGGSGYHQWYRSDSSSGDGLCDYYSDVGGVQTNIARISCGGSWSNKTGSYNTLSDVRKKKNVRDARKYLDSLCRLRVRKYSWDDEEGTEPSQLGFIAQEVEGVMPGLVETSEWGDLKDFKSLKTTILIPMLVSAVQTLAERLTALEGGQAASAPESCPESSPVSA